MEEPSSNPNPKLRRVPEIVAYVAPRHKAKSTNVPKIVPDIQSVTTSSKSSKAQDNVVTMRTARFDVHKFGISGFSKEAKEEAKIKLAVKLGAKKPKNKYVNYKELMEGKQIAKQNLLDRRKVDRAMGYKVKKVQSKQNRRDHNDIPGFKCQIGQYKDGIQHIPRKFVKSQRQK